MSYRTFSRLINYKCIIFILCFATSAVFSEELVISKYEYGLYKGNIYFGVSEQKLIKNGSNYRFDIKSNSAGIFKLKKDDRLETSIFSRNNNMIIPVSYKFKKEKRTNSQLIETVFDPKNNYAYTIEDEKKQEHIDIPYSLDRLSVQIDFQEKMKIGIFEYDYNIIDKGRLRKYSFRTHSDDVIDTIFGETNTIVIRKSIENNKRSTLTWYAIDYDFIPVKIEQYRKKSLKFSVILNKVYK